MNLPSTPTPWKMVKSFVHDDLFAIDCEDTTLPYVADYLEEKDAERIIECVHAFEGVEDPAEFMATLKKYQFDQVPSLVARLEKLEAALKHIVADSNEHPYIQKLAEEALKS